MECKRSTESVLNLLSSLDKPSLKNNVTINTFCNESSSDTGFTKTNEGDNSFSPIQENQFLNKYQQPNLCLKVFNVVYGKQTKKKHKTWEGDGILEVGSKYLVLKDENGTVISKFLNLP